MLRRSVNPTEGVLLVFVFNFCFNFERSDQNIREICEICVP